METADADERDLADFAVEGATFQGATGFGDRRFAGRTDFAGAIFDGPANFGRAVFTQRADFRAARFNGDVNFGDATFEAGAAFTGAHVAGSINFGGARFRNQAAFEKTEFGDAVNFGDATFEAGAQFDHAQFTADVNFGDATFGSYAVFEKAHFGDAVNFGDVTFETHTTFKEASSAGDVNFGDATFREHATFEKAQFGEAVNFGDVTFGQPPLFDEAAFGGDVGFVGTAFPDGASFDGAAFSGTIVCEGVVFGGSVAFRRTRFGGPANFAEASLEAPADFDEARFEGPANFGGADFRQRASFRGATFNGVADFRGVLFADHASFEDVLCAGEVDLAAATFALDAEFSGSRFRGARELGPTLVFGDLNVERCVFEQRVRVQISARRALFGRVAFQQGANLFLRRADVLLEDADFAGSSLLTELAAPAEPGALAGLGWERPPEGEVGWTCSTRDAVPAKTRLVSLRRARVAELTISGMDLKGCRFAGTHGLDGVGLERLRFAQPPQGRQAGPRRRNVRWTRRWTLAEEQQWRREHGFGAEWYWLLSGYGLRASRALAALAVMVLVFAAGFETFGFAAQHATVRAINVNSAGAAIYRRVPPPSPSRSERALDAVSYSVGTATAILGAPERRLTRMGKVLRLLLRLPGPILVGLALVSIRGRVKR